MSARVIVTTVLFVLWVVGGAAARPAVGDPAAGAALFRTRCLECHVADLRRFQADSRSLAATAAAMWNHAPRMAELMRVWKTERPYFTSGEIRDLHAFLSPQADPRPARGNPERGERLVIDKGCLRCHSTSAQAGTRGGSLDELKGVPSPSSIVAQLWNHTFLMNLEREALGAAWPRFTDTEMIHLVAYLERINTTKRRP